MILSMPIPIIRSFKALSKAPKIKMKWKGNQRKGMPIKRASGK
jgi:hypothetical protein